MSTHSLFPDTLMPRVSPAAKARLEGARRTQILAAAALIFARKGSDRATVTEIARAAGLAEGSIYNYFRSKEELLVHIPRKLAQPVLATLLEPTPMPASADEMEALLLRMAEAMVERVRTHVKFLKVFFSALPYLSPAARETYMQLLPVYGASVRRGGQVIQGGRDPRTRAAGRRRAPGGCSGRCPTPAEPALAGRGAPAGAAAEPATEGGGI